MSCLVIVSGREKGRTCTLAKDRDTVVGRVSDCDVCLADPRSSRRHCVIAAGQAGYLVRDLGSANGTLLNGRKITEAPLKEGDKLTVGVTEMEFHVDERFEDAETKKLAGGGGLPPEAAVTAPRRAIPPRLDTQAIEFCARCAGSVPAGAEAAGKARRTDAGLVCAECLAGEQAGAEAGRIGADPASLATRPSETAEDVLNELTGDARAPEAPEAIALDEHGLPIVAGPGPGRPADPDADKTPVPRDGGPA